MATGKLVIVENYGIAAFGSANLEPSAQNMITNDPKEVYVAESGGAQAIYMDLGSPVWVDSFYIGYTNAGPATLTVYSSPAWAGGGGSTLVGAETPIRAADVKTPRSSLLIKRAAPVNVRYLSFILSANAGVPLNVGILRAGISFEAEWDREWGSGRRPIDTGRSTALLGGGFGTQPGVRKGAYSWTFGDLTEAELEQLWGVFIRNGTTTPVIVNEVDGATVGANEKLHYGLFQRLDPWERREPNATKWSMEVEEWV